MFYIFGSPRSGTTLLAQCLNAHSRIVVPHETDCIIPIAFLCDRITDPVIGRDLIARTIVNGSAFRASLGSYLDPDDVTAIVDACEYSAGAIIDGLFAELASRAGCALAGDKSPNDLHYLRILVKAGGISPDTRILHIVRDVRDVVASLQEQQWADGLDQYFARFWNNANLYLHHLYKNTPSRYLLLHYEQVVADPEKKIAEACRHLGIGFERAMLDPCNRDPAYRSMPAHAQLYQAISGNRVGRYRSDLNAEQIARCEAQAAEGMKTLGYI